MTMIKSLILGSAAGLVALSGAQAADLPVKAKAVEYVRICSLYGAGFFYIPGTDTCIKLGGYVRVDTTFNGTTYGGPAWNGDQGQGNRYPITSPHVPYGARVCIPAPPPNTACPHLRQGASQSTTSQRHKNPKILTAPGVKLALLSGAGGGYVAVEIVYQSLVSHHRQVGFGLRDARTAIWQKQTRSCWLARTTDRRNTASTLPVR